MSGRPGVPDPGISRRVRMPSECQLGGPWHSVEPVDLAIHRTLYQCRARCVVRDRPVDRVVLRDVTAVGEIGKGLHHVRVIVIDRTTDMRIGPGRLPLTGRPRPLRCRRSTNGSLRPNWPPNSRIPRRHALCRGPCGPRGCTVWPMSSDAHLCLVCQSGFDPDDEVLRATHSSSEMVGVEQVSRKETRYAHVDEEQQVLALGGWTVVDRGPLHDFPP